MMSAATSILKQATHDASLRFVSTVVRLVDSLDAVGSLGHQPEARLLPRLACASLLESPPP